MSSWRHQCSIVPNGDVGTYCLAAPGREKCAFADPDDTGGQRLLAVIHERLGDAAIAAWDLTAARTAHQARLDIAERLAAADPVNAKWQRDLERARQRISGLDG